MLFLRLTLSGVAISLAACATSPRGHETDSAALADVTAERGKLLREIYERLRVQHPRGVSPEGDIVVCEAEIARYAFSRDSAPTLDRKLNEQAKLAAVESERAALFVSLQRHGRASDIDVLRAQERAAAAKQLLFELELKR